MFTEKLIQWVSADDSRHDRLYLPFFSEARKGCFVCLFHSGSSAFLMRQNLFFLLQMMSFEMISPFWARFWKSDSGNKVYLFRETNKLTGFLKNHAATKMSLLHPMTTPIKLFYNTLITVHRRTEAVFGIWISWNSIEIFKKIITWPVIK